MGTTIFIFVIVMLLIVATYICAKLDDKLLKEKATTKNLREELRIAKDEIAWCKSRFEEVNRGFIKKSHEKDALQKDYDLLYNDYLTIQQEIEK